MEAELIKALLVIGLIVVYGMLTGHMRKNGIPVPGEDEDEEE